MTTTAPPPLTPSPSQDQDASVDFNTQSLTELVHGRDVAELEAICEHAEGADLAHEITHLAEEDRAELLGLLPAETAADVLSLLPESQRVDAIEAMESRIAAEIVQELPTDEQADLIAELDEAEAADVLAEMSPEDAANIRELVAYDEDTAAGLMRTDFLAFPASSTVGEVVAGLQDAVESDRGFDTQYVYITGENGGLIGVVRLRDLLLSPRSRPTQSITIKDFDAVDADDSLESLEAFFDEHSFFAAPVLDPAGRMLGVVQRSSVEQALGERRGEEYNKAQGIIGGDELRSMPLRIRCGRRLSWLSLNILLNIAAASIIAVNQDTLEQLVILAVFLPIISDMSGCSGNQAVAVSMRELSLNVARPGDWARVWGKEALVGVVNGTALGILIGLVAWAWQGNFVLGLVVGTALGLNTLVAVSIGGVVPLLLKGLRLDPALASGPILTTVTDMCGFFLVLTFASMTIAYLV